MLHVALLLVCIIPLLVGLILLACRVSRVDTFQTTILHELVEEPQRDECMVNALTRAGFFPHRPCEPVRLFAVVRANGTSEIEESDAARLHTAALCELDRMQRDGAHADDTLVGCACGSVLHLAVARGLSWTRVHDGPEQRPRMVLTTLA